MKRNFLTFLALVLAIPVLAQNDDTKDPGDIKIDVRYLEDADFKDYDSYQFVTSTGNMDESSWVAMNSIPSAMIEDAMEHEMDASGMSSSMGNEADVIVNYHLFSNEWEPKAYMVSDNAVFLYMSEKNNGEAPLENGTLVMNIMDAQTGEIIWEGYAMGVVDSKSDLRTQRKQIRMGVAELAERFLSFRNLGAPVAGDNGRPFRSDDYR
ncbi:MAG: DUF4136 domain-containing protein [Cyclobacteriaceae bacterium]